jgi:hypothetical protein
MSDTKTMEQDYGIGHTGERALLLHRRLGFRTLLTIVDSSVTRVWYLPIRVKTICFSVRCSNTMAARGVRKGTDDRLSVLGFCRCIVTRFHVLPELLRSFAERLLYLGLLFFSFLQAG